jgi:hypothetical protein
MTNPPYVTFMSYPGGPQTFYLPQDNAFQELLRDLAHDVFRHEHILRKAYADYAVNMEILLPQHLVPEHLRGEAKTATLMGLPVRLVVDLKDPMIAYELCPKKLPS